MRKTVFLKSTFRQPFRSLFLLLLVGMISVAFASRVGEYMLIDQETTQIGSYYRSLGRLEMLGDHNAEQDKLAEYLKNDSRVATVNQLRYFSGLLPEGIYNADSNDSCNYGPSSSCHDIFFYGTMMEVAGPDKNIINGREHDWYYYTVQVDKVVAGYPEYLSEGMILELTAASGEEGDAEALAALHSQLEEGKRYLIRAYYDITDLRCVNLEPARLPVKSLSATELRGERPDYAVVRETAERYYMQMEDTWFLEAPTDLDLTRPEYAPIYEDLQKVMENQRAVGILEISDVSAYSEVQEESRVFNLTEGRWPNKMDTVQGARVCAVPQELAEARGLHVGDSVEITLRDVPATVDGRTGDGEPYYIRCIRMRGGYVLSIASILQGEGYSHTGEKAVEQYEIVGIYTCTEPDITKFLFVPGSTVPAHWYRPLETDGIVLTSPQEEDTFIEATQYDLQCLGWRAIFYPNNSAGFYATANSIKGSALSNVYIFAVILIACLCFAGFVYFRFRRRDLAISRALGVTVRQCVLGISIPFLVLGGVGAGGGVAAAWWYVGGHTEELLSAFTPFARGDEVVTLNIFDGAIVWLGILLLLLAIVLAFAVVMAHKSTLYLLQGNNDGNKNAKKVISVEADALGSVTATQITHSIVPTQQNVVKSLHSHSPKWSALVRYTNRHIIRSAGKSLLCLILAAVFMMGLMLIRISAIRSEDELERLYNTIPVEMEVVVTGDYGSNVFGPISQFVVNQIMDTDYISDSYLVGTYMASWVVKTGNSIGNMSNSTDFRFSVLLPVPEGAILAVALTGVDNVDEYFEREELGDYEIVYADGFDESVFHTIQSGNISVVLSRALCQELHVELGEKVEICTPRIDRNRDGSDIAVVAGIYNCGDENAILLPQNDLRRLPFVSPSYSKAIFTIDPKLNRQLDTVREELSRLVQKGSSDSANLTAIYWDQELRQAITPMEQVISVMKALYPVTLGLSFIVAAGIAVLLSLLSAKEAAILRVLGNSKTTCRVILCLQTILPCIVGLLIGHLGAVAMAYLMLPAEDTAGLMLPALGRVGLYLLYTVLGAVGASAVMTGKNPLELLQVKE